MNNQNHFFLCHLAMALVLPLTLAACGGEETTTVTYDSTPAPSTQLTRSGKILPHALGADALICLDLTGTGACDASAATATRARGDGSYVIHYQPRDAADAENFKTAPLLAEISGEQGSYTLSSPGKHSNNITPLTTLVHRQMLQARTLQAAEQEIARQLDIHVEAIYDIHQSSVAMAAAALTHYALKNGIPTMDGCAAETPDNSAQLVSLNFKDAHNYEYDVHAPEGSANAAGQMLWRPVYGGKVNGNDRTPENAAYTARNIDGFISTGREEYLKNGVLKLFSASNQFTTILLNRDATARSTQSAQIKAAVGYTVATTVQKMDVSGQSMQTFFADTASYQLPLKDIVHLDAFKVHDPSILDNAVFPQGSVLHIQLSTPVGNKNSIEYSETKPGENANRVSHSSTTSAGTLEQRANDLNPAQPRQPARALVVKYSLNERAWTATKQALKLP